MASMSAGDTPSCFPYCPPSNAPCNYDVFMSFRGEDTRKNFADHLYAALLKRGLIVFRDDLSLEKGKAIAQELLKAIEKSRLSVTIFSRNYASSTWCLDEVLKIVQCKNKTGHIVLPIFYNVDPSEVRRQTGKYKKAFIKHEKAFKNNIERVHKWRAALEEVASLSGWDLKDQHEHDFIQDIVKVIWKKLKPIPPPAIGNFVGMDSRLSELSSCLSIGSDDVCIIGICGMGGIGKTTIARSYYSCMSYRFEGSVFLANVKEVSSKHGMLPLQKQLLRKLVHRKIEIEEISDVYEVVEMIKTELRFKKVLIVIDDVDQLNQLEELAGERNWFGSGSRIIVTTRDVNLLVRLGVDKIYKVKGLNDDEALQLFSLKAFKCELVPKDYMMLSTSIVKYANGLPLALKVLGSFLFGKTMKEWRSAFARMKENPVREILDTLQISFDGLEETEKKIFLDIACFFKGKDTVSVTKIWDSCGFYPDIGISVLRDKCLITVLENSLLWMHDLLQALAWKIVQQESPREPGKRSRLWLSEDIFHVMTKNTGTEDVEGIVLELLAPVEKKLNAKALSKLTKLRLLVFCNVHFSLEQESLSHELEYLSNELRILKWHDYPYRNLPSSFHPEELIELDMSYSQVKQLWKGIKNFKKLKTIILSHSKNLVKTPDFRGVPNLEKLILEGCEKL